MQSNPQAYFRQNMCAVRQLECLNFFVADMQAGIGPFLGVSLLAHGWESGLIGSVMTIGAASLFKPACAQQPDPAMPAAIPA